MSVRLISELFSAVTLLVYYLSIIFQEIFFCLRTLLWIVLSYVRKMIDMAYLNSVFHWPNYSLLMKFLEWKSVVRPISSHLKASIVEPLICQRTFSPAYLVCALLDSKPDNFSDLHNNKEGYCREKISGKNRKILKFTRIWLASMFEAQQGFYRLPRNWASKITCFHVNWISANLNLWK